MKKILKEIISSIIISHIIFLMIPFNIHADETVNTAPFLGFNVQITGYGENMSSIQIPKINFSYAGNTVPSGYISGKLNCTSPSTPTSSAPCDIFSLTNNNGSYSDLAGLKVVFPLQSYLLDANGNAIINHQSYFFIEYEFILDDSYKGYVTITSSDNVDHLIYVNGDSFHYETFTQDPANPLTFSISDYELIKNSLMAFANYDMPMPTLFYIQRLYARNNLVCDIKEYNKIGYYRYPLVDCPTGYKLVSNLALYPNGSVNSQGLPRDSLIVIGAFEGGISSSNIASKLGLDTSKFQYTSINTFYQFTYSLNGSLKTFVVQAFKITNLTTGYATPTLAWTGADTVYIPIWLDYEYNRWTLPTEFCLEWNLENEFLHKIDVMAYGTTQSNQSAADLQQSTDSMQDQMDDMASIESGYNQQFNNSLNNIDFTNPIQNNAGILPAANFVITVFNGLVNNPLSILIIIICILTIGKKVTGK